ncbi:MAG: magnesium transporter, partial [Pseudomonadota bacterium]
MAEYARHEKTEKQLQQLSDAIKTGRLQPVRRMINTLPPGEIADLLESLPPEPRALVWELVDQGQDGEILVEVADEVRAGLIDAMEDEALVEATAELEIDDLADILDDLPDPVIRQVLQDMDSQDRERLTQVLAYPEDSAGGLMNPDVPTIRADVTLDVVQRYLRMRGELPEPIDSLYVVDRDGRHVGRLAFVDLLVRSQDQTDSDLIKSDREPIPVDLPAGEVAMRFEHHDYVSAPVIDQHGMLLGRITIDDIVDVIRDQAEHDVLSMAGLDEEDDMFAPVLIASRRRALYLGLNLVTAFVAGWFVGLFDKTLEQAVALAVLMPVVASMGGIAGTQTLTLMIRGFATGQVGSGNTAALLRKELAIGTLNGLLWATVVGIVAMVWFDRESIGFVAAAAVLLNLAGSTSRRLRTTGTITPASAPTARFRRTAAAATKPIDSRSNQTIATMPT